MVAKVLARNGKPKEPGLVAIEARAIKDPAGEIEVDEVEFVPRDQLA